MKKLVGFPFYSMVLAMLVYVLFLAFVHCYVMLFLLRSNLKKIPSLDTLEKMVLTLLFSVTSTPFFSMKGFDI
jgi:hypothetical protein